MGADAIVYCLEKLTDYDQFERLCHDLMALHGYPAVEPLGGRNDKGRDAIHISKPSGEVTIFAYSVREDWKKKLSEDAEKIRTHEHACDRLVFLSTSSLSAHERDSAIESIKAKYGWKLELYGLERLRTMLATTCAQLIAHHPQIFTPPFFPVAGDAPLSPRDMIILDHSDEDKVLAKWLVGRLTLEGYDVWSQSTAATAGLRVDNALEDLIANRAFAYLPMLSPGAIANPDMNARRATIHTLKGSARCELMIPIVASSFNGQGLDSKTREIRAIPFQKSWGDGIKELLKSLVEARCPRTGPLPNFAISAFLPESRIVESSERIISNRLRVTRIPAALQMFRCDTPIDYRDIGELASKWAFRRISPTSFVSFQPPPATSPRMRSLKWAGAKSWMDFANFEGIPCDHLVLELITKSIRVHLAKKGLLYCPMKHHLFFPEGLPKSNRLYFKKPDGAKSFINTTGIRTFWRPTGSSKYRYSLAPYLRASGDPCTNSVYILARIYIRITDENNGLLTDNSAKTRRKDLCRGWWNDDWLSRVLAIAQFLSEDGISICMGHTESDLLKINCNPDEWSTCLGIDEASLFSPDKIREEAMILGADPDESLEGDDISE